MNFVLDWFFPPRCLACDRFAKKTLCPDCQLQFPFLTPPYCPGCLLPYEPAVPSNHLCADCLLEPPPYQKIIGLGVYRGILLDLVKRMKYRRDERVGEILGDWLGDQVAREGIYEKILPVPLHPRRMRERGFNQAAVIGKRVGKKIGSPVDLFLLTRTRETASQTCLSREERNKNLRGAFQLADQERVRDRSFLLIDDVYTTGATLRASAQLLNKAGARVVDVAILARTPT